VDYRADTYGERIADVYDDWHAARAGFDALGTERAVAALTALAAEGGGGRVLELGVGTGRLALPLAAGGLDVSGIDASPAMVAQLRAKPGGDRVPVTIGDFADVAVDGPFSLVFVAFNTFFALHSQDDQVRCMANAAARLSPGGLFVVEAFVPDLGRFRNGNAVSVVSVDLDRVVLDASVHDPVGQTVEANHVVITGGGTRLQPIRLRYAWPPELDLMARIAGLRLRDRWAGWDRAPFTASAGSAVSVYERPAD
jgi:SAM-dependent methyltransferase